MYVSRVVIRNFRNFRELDVSLDRKVTCIIGENNTGKTNLLHAIRLAIDANLSSTYRTLNEHDIHSGVDISVPEQVIVSVEFSDFSDEVNETALVGCWITSDDDDVARVTYRFRPRKTVRDAIENEGREPSGLALDDYHWEITGGGEKDPLEVQWNEDLGQSIRFAYLQEFLVVYLHALRDVQQELRRSRYSPLARLFEACEISEQEKANLVEIMRAANKEIATSEMISQAGSAISAALDATAGEAFKMGVSLGMADPSFVSIARSLTVLLSNEALEDFEPARNGLGLNNILYISMLLEYFERRVAVAKTAGQLLLFEEPEAHIHPQLQRTLLQALRDKGFQTIVSTHSTHVSSSAPVSSYIVLTNRGHPAISACNVAVGAELSTSEEADIDRYLDATRSALLYARKVILVEGPAEQFLIPVLSKNVLGIDLDSHGVSIIPIYGVHFGVYAKLFAESCLPKKCAIIADGDLKPSDSSEIDATDDADGDPPVPQRLTDLENEYVRVFACATTFERTITIEGMLPVLAEAANDCGQETLSRALTEAITNMGNGALNQSQKNAVLNDLGERVLRGSKRVGKARFAQLASRHAEKATDVPTYIRSAIEWITTE